MFKLLRCYFKHVHGVKNAACACAIYMCLFSIQNNSTQNQGPKLGRRCCKSFRWRFISGRRVRILGVVTQRGAFPIHRLFKKTSTGPNNQAIISSLRWIPNSLLNRLIFNKANSKRCFNSFKFKIVEINNVNQQISSDLSKIERWQWDGLRSSPTEHHQM